MKLTAYLKKFKKEVILGPLVKLLEALFELIVPLVMASIIDVGVKNKDVGFIVSRGGIMVLLAAVGLAFSLTCQYYASRASQGTGTLLRRDMFRHINGLSYHDLDRVGTPTLITRLTGDINQVQLGVAMVIRLALRSPFLVVGCAVMAMVIDWKVGLIFLGAIPLITVVLYLILKSTVPMYKVIQSKLDRIILVTRENLAGQRVVRAFSKEKHEIDRFEKSAEDYTKRAVRVGKITGLLNPLTYVIINLAVVAVVWLGGIQVDAGDMTQGEVIAMVNYMMQILLALVVTADLVIIFTKAYASLQRVKEVFALPSTMRFANQEEYKNAQLSNPNTDNKAPKIEFKNVTLGYVDGAKPAVNKLSFALCASGTLGIIGGTGSGKTSIVNLIARYYDATDGEVLLDGIPIHCYPEDVVRNKVSVVPQKAVLFSGTIRSNLLWGKEDATEDDMIKALTIAQAKEFVSDKKGGLDAPVSQNGKNFSGGQRQRLTIARAVVKNSEILILDDSASALDYRTDARLRKAIRTKLSKDLTLVLVSQRVATVKNCDVILVMDGGDAVGIGTHDELLNGCGTYGEIYRSQTKKEANE